MSQNTFVQCYDEKRIQLLGSDHSFYVDGRLSISSIIKQLQTKFNQQKKMYSIDKKYVPCFVSEVKIFNGRRFNENTLITTFNI